MILKDFNLPGVTEQDIFKAYKDPTAHKGQMLLIDSLKQQMRLNFKVKIINYSQEE